MLKLFVNPEQAGSARVPVRWCVDRESLEQMKVDGATVPYLFLIVVHEHSGETLRKLVPLDQLMEYIDFHRAGTHTIRAAVVWQKEGNMRLLKARMLGGKYQGMRFRTIRALDGEGNLWFDPEMLDGANVGYAEDGEITVSVDSKFFAPEPSAFEDWWVNLWFEKEKRDQCQFRKRRFVAYTIQPLVVLGLYLPFLYLVRFACTAFFLSICQRGISFKPLLHPWDFATADIWWKACAEKKGTIFTKTREGKETNFRVILVPLSPIAHVIPLALVLLANRFGKDLGVSFLGAMGYAFLVQCMAIGGLCVLAMVTLSLDALPALRRRFLGFMERHPVFAGRLVETLLTIVAAVAVAAFIWLNLNRPYVLATIGVAFVCLTLLWVVNRAIARWERMRFEQTKAFLSDTGDQKAMNLASLAVYDALTCKSGALQVNVAALPKSRQTLYLRFQDLKTRLCKPYGR